MLVQVVEGLSAWVEHIVLFLGVPGVTVIALLENLFPPTPSEILYPLAGKMAYDGAMTVPMIVLAGIAGSLMGSLVYYMLGYRLGKEQTRIMVEHFGTFRLWKLRLKIVGVDEFDRGIELFEKHGGKIVVVARVMPLVHSVVSIPAGVSRMALVPFIAYTVIGSALWIIPLVVLGYWLGSNWEQLLHWMDIYEYVWYAVVGAALVYFFSRRFRNRKQGI
jgi:membrane protein DedA with SNARE-associated domain